MKQRGKRKDGGREEKKTPSKKRRQPTLAVVLVFLGGHTFNRDSLSGGKTYQIRTREAEREDQMLLGKRGDLNHKWLG